MHSLSVAEMTAYSPIGNLGVPLGTAMEIRAVVVSGAALLSKRYASRYLLQITHIDGRALAKPILLEFSRSSIFAKVPLASNHFELYALKTGIETGSLTETQIAELEKGYVGKEVNVMAYELGGFYGEPRHLAQHRSLSVQEVGGNRRFRFEPHLIVLDDPTY